MCRLPETRSRRPEYRKKLIEVSIPLEAINAASAREKSIRHGHPSTLHLWWARRPLAACRAVLFAQLVDDPSSWPGRYPFPEIANDEDSERRRLHKIIEAMVPWEASNDEAILNAARWEIARSVAWNRDPPEEPPEPGDGKAILEYLQTKAPPVYDPFCGGGSIPLEAQRLGLRAYGSDLNPVAVLISKALVEIPPKFANRPPVNPQARAEATNGQLRAWKGAQGLAEDVRYYGKWMREEAEKRIGHDAAGRLGGDGDRLAVGAHGALARPGCQGRHGAAGVVFHALDQRGQEGLGRAGYRPGCAGRLALRGAHGRAAEGGRGEAEERD